MAHFLVLSPLALAIGAEVAKVGEIVELPDDEGARLVANGTVEPTDAPEAEADESAPVRKARAKA